jgi:streptogramin lyase
MTTARRLALLLSSLAALACACGKDAPPAEPTPPPQARPARDEQPAAPTEPPEPEGAPERAQEPREPLRPLDSAGITPKDAAATVVAPAPGPDTTDARAARTGEQPATAWLGTKSGVVALDHAGFRVAIPGLRSVRDMALGPDGTLWVASIGAVHRLRAGEVDQVGDFRSPGSVDHVATGPDGALWATSFSGVARYDGEGWALFGKDQLGEGVTLLNDIAVDDRGRVWVVSANAIHVREADAWRTLPAGEHPEQRFFKRIVASTEGTVFAAQTAGVLRIAGDAVTQVETGPGFFSISGLAVGPPGTLHVASLGAIVRIPAGGEPRTWSRKSNDFTGRMVLAVGADSRGRTWASTDDGLVVIDADGTVEQWRTGTVPALTDSIEQILVSGEGPELPPPGEQATGAVEGRLVRGDEPVVGARIEVCRRPSLVFRDSPCGEAPFAQSAVTGEGGAFRFEGLPVGTWRFAVRQDDKWTVTLSDCCAGMKAGETWDAGAIDLAK